MDIILVRHGETEWNVGEIFRGRADIELNENGRKQAAFLGEYLSHFDISAIYSGPLKRTMDTANAVARYHGLQVGGAPGLVDMSFGEWEGQPVEVVKQKYGELFTTWTEHPEQAKIPGGETLVEIRGRAVNAADEIIAKNTGNVVLVSHRVIIKILVLAFLGLGESHFWSILIDPSSVTTFGYDGKRYVLKHHNETCFLREAAAHRRDF